MAQQQQQAPPLVAAYVRRLRGGSPAQRAQAAAVLESMLQELDAADVERFEAAAAAIVANGGIPPLVQLARSDSVDALLLLGALADRTANRSQAILAAGGVQPMVQCLSSGHEEVQWAAAFALAMLAYEGSGGDAACASIAAAGGIAAAARSLGSGSAGSKQLLLELLYSLAADSPQRQRAIIEAGGVAAAAALLRSPASDVVNNAGRLLSIRLARSPEGREAIRAAGVVPALVALLDSGDSGMVEAACRTLHALVCSSRPPNATPQQVTAAIAEAGMADAAAAAGAIPALVRCLRRRGLSDEALEWAAELLAALTSGSLERSQAFVAAGGVQATLQALERQPADGLKAIAAAVLLDLVLGRQAEAIAAADPTNAASAALEWLQGADLSQWVGDADGLQRELTEALRLLAAARQAAQAGPSAAAATPPQPPQPPRPPIAGPRVCAAPGCVATSGLRRCRGCHAVRYCSEACSRAHWRAHKAECRRLVAEQQATQQQQQP